MRMFLISDNGDTLTGMRLAGVEGVVVRTRDCLLYTSTVRALPAVPFLCFYNVPSPLCGDAYSSFFKILSVVLTDF